MRILRRKLLIKISQELIRKKIKSTELHLSLYLQIYILIENQLV